MPVAVVTGANSGIGLALARLLRDEGFTVHVGARDANRGMTAVATLGSGASLLHLDVTEPESVLAAARTIEQLDVLVNNAGVSDDGTQATAADLEMYRAVYETNVFGVVTVTNAFVPVLRQSPHPRIVNVSSGTASLTWSTGRNPQFDHVAMANAAAAYRSSKAALNALTVMYAQALDAHGFKVNALAPGLRATNLNEWAAALGEDPAEAARGALWLARLPDDGPTGKFFSWDTTEVPW
jgi:NAD(P)-dependent dehydrogenase (short-subunit alcohol dehydrogenase family)